ncbi:MAG: GntR family transcriptional regulator [Agarilytica sp.]
MVDIGRFNVLEVVKTVDFGVYLDGGELGTILLPKRYMPKGCALGDRLSVFIYMDSEDLLIATTETPKVCVGECAHLVVSDVNDTGAFLDWGLSKDLLVPYAEQHKPMDVGKSYVVCVYLDEYTDRIVASSRLSRHLQEFSMYFKQNQPVDLLICGRSDMGYKAVVNHTHLGLVFRDEAFSELKYGQKTKGYIQAIRKDKKIDLSLQLPAGLGRDELSEKILAYMKEQGGVSTLTDKSDPKEIYRLFNVSKNNYKKALGKLYKEKRILIEKNKVTLL